MECFMDEIRNNDYWGAYLPALTYRHHIDWTEEGFKKMQQMALCYGIRMVLEYLHEDLQRLDFANQRDAQMPEFGDIAYVLNLLRVYMPDLPTREEPPLNDPEVFGSCPVCGKNDGYLNLHRTHWFVCHEHRKKWMHGANLFSTWRFETEIDWQENFERIRGYEEVMPMFAGRQL
jgi:hypothetical protein